MYTSSFDGSIFLRLMTGLDLEEPHTVVIELGILCFVNLLGMLSISLKKIVEKRKSQQEIQTINILPPISLMPIHEAQESRNENSQQSCFNNVAFNKPLLSLLPTIALSITMMTFYCFVFITNYFESDENSKELKLIYHTLLTHITVDFVIPLLYCLHNRDYRKHIKRSCSDFFGE